MLGKKIESKLNKYIMETPLWKVFTHNTLIMMVIGFLVQMIGGIDMTDVIFNIILSLFYGFAMTFFSFAEQERERIKRERNS